MPVDGTVLLHDKKPEPGDLIECQGCGFRCLQKFWQSLPRPTDAPGEVWVRWSNSGLTPTLYATRKLADAEAVGTKHIQGGMSHVVGGFEHKHWCESVPVHGSPAAERSQRLKNLGYDDARPPGGCADSLGLAEKPAAERGDPDIDCEQCPAKTNCDEYEAQVDRAAKAEADLERLRGVAEQRHEDRCEMEARWREAMADADNLLQEADDLRADRDRCLERETALTGELEKARNQGAAAVADCERQIVEQRTRIATLEEENTGLKIKCKCHSQHVGENPACRIHNPPPQPADPCECGHPPGEVCETHQGGALERAERNLKTARAVEFCQCHANEEAGVGLWADCVQSVLDDFLTYLKGESE
jgi:hypothetical protein